MVFFSLLHYVLFNCIVQHCITMCSIVLEAIVFHCVVLHVIELCCHKLRTGQSKQSLRREKSQAPVCFLQDSVKDDCVNYEFIKPEWRAVSMHSVCGESQRDRERGKETETKTTEKEIPYDVCNCVCRAYIKMYVIVFPRTIQNNLILCCLLGSVVMSVSCIRY